MQAKNRNKSPESPRPSLSRRKERDDDEDVAEESGDEGIIDDEDVAEESGDEEEEVVEESGDEEEEVEESPKKEKLKLYDEKPGKKNEKKEEEDEQVVERFYTYNPKMTAFYKVSYSFGENVFHRIYLAEYMKKDKNGNFPYPEEKFYAEGSSVNEMSCIIYDAKDWSKCTGAKFHESETNDPPPSVTPDEQSYRYRQAVISGLNPSLDPDFEGCVMDCWGVKMGTMMQKGNKVSTNTYQIAYTIDIRNPYHKKFKEDIESIVEMYQKYMEWLHNVRGVNSEGINFKVTSPFYQVKANKARFTFYTDVIQKRIKEEGKDGIKATFKLRVMNPKYDDKGNMYTTVTEYTENNLLGECKALPYFYISIMDVMNYGSFRKAKTSKKDLLIPLKIQTKTILYHKKITREEDNATPKLNPQFKASKK